jgi:hypothetical protein
MATAPKPEDLRKQSVHVLWEFRQLMRLATHLYDRREKGVVELVDPLDAAALESFCIHARALVEFLWRDREHKPKADRRDAVAGDWFEAGTWDYQGELPDELSDLERRTGFGVAHISYNRINAKEAWGWNHVEIAHRIAWRFACFVDDVSAELVHPQFKDEATTENMAFRTQMAESDLGILPPPPQPVGTPAHPSVWIALPRR